MLKQKSNDASHEEKLQIKKYLFRLVWNLQENQVTSEFYDKYYKLTHVLQNLRSIDKPHLIQPIFDNGIIDIDASKKKEQINYILDMLHLLGFNGINDNKSIEQKTFENNIENIKLNSKIFSNPNLSQPLFNYNKSKLTNILKKKGTNNKPILGFINSIFSNYGFKIIHLRKLLQKNKIKTSHNFYKIKFIENLDSYL
jgi:hypothetical protein